MRREASLLLGALALGCAGAPSSPEPAVGAPTPVGYPPIAGLPPPTLVPTETEPDFAELWYRVEAALATPLAPEPREVEARARWEAEVHAPWLEARADAIGQSIAHLRRLLAAPSEQQAVGAALLAHLLEETARTSGAVNPEEGRALRDRARRAYRRCLRHGAASPPEAHLWVRFCEARSEALGSPETSPRQVE